MPTRPTSAGKGQAVSGFFASALRILKTFSRTLVAEFFAFFFARVPGEEPPAAKRGAQISVVLKKGARNSQGDGTALTGDSAPFHFGPDAELIQEIGLSQGGLHPPMQGLPFQILEGLEPVDRKSLFTRKEPNLGHGFLASAGCVINVGRCRRSRQGLTPQGGSAFGHAACVRRRRRRADVLTSDRRAGFSGAFVTPPGGTIPRAAAG